MTLSHTCIGRGRPKLVLALLGVLTLGCVATACSIQFSKPDAAYTQQVENFLISASEEADPDKAHMEVFLKNRYPSAFACAACHPNHFQQWSVSQHAYAQLSPVFNAMQSTIAKRTNGTNGDFCIRCHTQVGMQLGEPVHMSNMDRAQVSREGVTCISCHRVNEAYGKVSSRIHVDAGALFEPVYGPTGNAELQKVLGESDVNRVTTDPEQEGRAIHGDVEKFFGLTTPAFCGSCHDVTLLNGFRLEEAFSEYKHSPAATQDGHTCQDCHMSTEPGRPSGYFFGPAAIVSGRPTKDRKITGHFWAGPDHSVIHPLLFPFNPEVYARWSMREMIQFDHAAGWGTDAFEDSAAAKNTTFPEVWASIDDRYAARDLVEKNQKLLDWAKTQRHAVLKEGYQFGDINVKQEADTYTLTVEVKNGTTGHNVPTGFTAERLTWLHVRVLDANGETVFVSGDTDPNGDVRDHHSLYVHDGELPLDRQLFTLQSKFLVRNVRGGEAELILPINHSIDPLPFVRPSTFSAILTGRPAGARLHKRGIEPGGSRFPEYRIDARRLGGVGPFTVQVELKSGMVPVHLVNEIKDVGFDYHMSARQIGDAIHQGHLVLHRREFLLQASADLQREGTAGGK